MEVTLPLEPTYDFGIDETSFQYSEQKSDVCNDHELRDLPSPSPPPSQKDDYGLRMPPSPSLSPPQKDDYGLRMLPSPSLSPLQKDNYGLRVLPSPSSSPSQKDDYGLHVPPSPSSSSSPSPSQKDDYGLRGPPSPSPELKSRLGHCVTFSPQPFLPASRSSQEGPSQIRVHQLAEAQEPLGSPPNARSAFYTTCS